MKYEQVALDTLKPLERNPRRHPEKQLVELEKSLAQFGQYRPLVVDEEGTVLAGNGLHQALVRTGQTTATVIRLAGLTDQQRTKLILADNRTADLGNDNPDIIEELLRELDDYDVPGYDAAVLKELLATADEIVERAETFGVIPDETVAEIRNMPPPALPNPRPLPQSEADNSPGPTGICPTCNRPW